MKGMQKNIHILFVVNKRFLKRWTRCLKIEFPLMNIDVIDFKTLYTLDNVIIKKYSLIIASIEKYIDLLKYKLHRRRKHEKHLVYLLDVNKKIFRSIITHNKILYRNGRLKESIDGLLNIMRSDGVVTINCNDILKLASESELLCQGTEGIKEIILFDMIANWEASECLRSSLVSIVGNVTLTDVYDICSLLNPYSAGSLLVGCRYEERENIKVFSLWKVM